MMQLHYGQAKGGGDSDQPITHKPYVGQTDEVQWGQVTAGLRRSGVSKHVYFSMKTSPSIQVNDAVVQQVESEGRGGSVELVLHKLHADVPTHGQGQYKPIYTSRSCTRRK